MVPLAQKKLGYLTLAGEGGEGVLSHYLKLEWH